jgi:hypothetical protein
MAGGWVGRSDGVTREVIDMYIGTPAGRRQIQNAYVGTPGGNKRWYTKTLDLVITEAVAVDHTAIRLSWNLIGPADKFTYHIYRGTAGLIALSGSTSSWTEGGLAASTTYTYTVYAVRNGIVADQASVAVATKAVPPPSTFSTGELRAWTSSTYTQSGTPGSFRGNRVTVGLSGPASSRGIQKSTWNFNIPGYVRNCSSISRVYMRVRIDHTYNSSYGDFGVVMHHNASQAMGSTGIFGIFRTKGAHQDTQGDCWLGEGYYGHMGDGWLDITGYGVPGSFGGRNWSVAEEFRIGGATGLGFAAPNGSNIYYGYGWGVGDTPDPKWWPSLIIEGTY